MHEKNTFNSKENVKHKIADICENLILEWEFKQKPFQFDC